ncbi:MAG TPA: hypothetical protein VG755_14925 [Nannocystaceae bacterium]|nr:hypothetical protein [Nannocystaceae bacterium]
MSRRSPRQADDLGAIAISFLLAACVPVSACVVSEGEVGGAAQPGDTSTDTSGGSIATTTSTSSGTGVASGAATTSDGGESDGARVDDGDAPHFDLGDGDRGAETSGGDRPEPEPDPDPPPANDGDCCEPGDGTGCGDVVVRDCVCVDDPYCCETTWDELCVAEVTSLGCGACGGVRPAGLDVADECCAVHESSDCNDAEISDCVCANDPYCCLVQWDQVCVDAIAQYGCGSCDVGTTSSGSEGSSSGTD